LHGFDAIDALARQTGEPIPQIALNWPLQLPNVATVAIGARNEELLRQHSGAVGRPLTKDRITQLDVASAVTPACP
jgi:aryl-alcohol dehydrogenase-like predicted oxidoreductase